MIRFINRVFVGFFVSIPIVCILAGGVEQGFMVLMLSIICTAGIGLVFWIPVWWIVGAITLALLRLYPGAADKESAGGIKDQSLNQWALQRNIALTNYVSQARTAGMDAAQITRRLRDNGWRPEEIDIALGDVFSTASGFEP